jgi:quercetin dioxygenase-like cupin family protein
MNNDVNQTPPPVTRQEVMTAPLSPAKRVEHVTVQKITMQPNVVGGPHVHVEPLLGVILSGSAILEIRGQRPRLLQAGDPFYEPAGAAIAQFSSGSEGVVFMAYSLLGDAENPRIEMLAGG